MKVVALFLKTHYKIFEIKNRMESDKDHLIETFLSVIKNTNSKQQFLSKVNDFDSRFGEENFAPSLSQKQRSVDKMPPMPPEKVKNPFKSYYEQNNQKLHQSRQNNLITGHTQANMYGQPQYPQTPQYTQQGFYNQNQASNLKLNSNQTKSQHNFYKAGSQHAQHQQYMMHNHPPQNYVMGNIPQTNAHNHNTISQRQYDELREQFFKPTNRPELYSRVGNQQIMGGAGGHSKEEMFNFNQMMMGLNGSQQHLGYEGGGGGGGHAKQKFESRYNPFRQN